MKINTIIKITTFVSAAFLVAPGSGAVGSKNCPPGAVCNAYASNEGDPTDCTYPVVPCTTLYSDAAVNCRYDSDPKQGCENDGTSVNCKTTLSQGRCDNGSCVIDSSRTTTVLRCTKSNVYPCGNGG